MTGGYDLQVKLTILYRSPSVDYSVWEILRQFGKFYDN
jgi:hypothetical protein